MAIIQANFISNSLMRSVTINVILPIDKVVFPGMPVPEFKPFKTLYLLHGVLGNYMDWIAGTNIQRWAEEKNLAVVMPSGENSFYLDQKALHNNYDEFVGKELVDITRKMFPISNKREDTYIAGLSMGGYGAFCKGMKYNDTFSHIAGLSSAFIIDGIKEYPEESPLFFQTKSYIEAVFGQLDQFCNSDKNPKWLAQKLVDDNKEIPKIYMACGESDTLFDANVDFYEYLNNLGIPVTFEKGPGNHEWDFWNKYIKRVLEWLPLKDKEAGINSGNVGI